KVQAASGKLTRAGGISLDLLDINVLSDNETATVVWSISDSSQSLAEGGGSLLTITSRAEPKGMHWTDSTHADVWGQDRMLLDPVRVQLTFKVAKENWVEIHQIDSNGVILGNPISSSDGKTFMIDQSLTKAVWYSVGV